MKKQKLNHFLFYLLATIVSGVFLALGVAPFMFIGTIYALIQNVTLESFPLDQLLHYFILPLVMYTALFLLLIKAPHPKAFFIALFLALFIGNSFIFPFEIVTQIGPYGLLFIFLYTVLISTTATLAWKGLIHESRKDWGKAVMLILVIDFILLIGTYPARIPSPFSLDSYILIGNYLEPLTHHNIFYLDYGRFVILAVNLVNALLILLTAFALRRKP